MRAAREPPAPHSAPSRLAQFSQHVQVRAEARRALRRLQSSEVLPPPSKWNEGNVLLWLSCVGLDEVRTAVQKLLSSSTTGAPTRTATAVGKSPG